MVLYVQMLKPDYIDHKIVLLFIKPRFVSQRERISGIYSAAIKRGWQIQPINKTPDAATVRECEMLWHPSGCLVDQSALSGRLDKRTFGKMPAALMGRDTTRVAQAFDCIHLNARDPAAFAVQELIRCGVKGFAYVCDHLNPPWSVERGVFFRESVGANEYFSEYSGRDPATMRGRKDMVAWLRGLPVPCGVLLAADHVAPAFYAAASAAKRRIGADLPTVGVDNDEQICRTLTPSLSSVKLDFFQSGADAVALLARRMESPQRPLQIMTFPSLGIVRRASTTREFQDRRMNLGMAFITEHGCEKISVDDVAETMGCCRRLAMSLFRKHARTSILDAIRDVRIEKSFLLLRNKSIAIDAVPFQCGYAASPSTFKTHFKRVTGMSMREWRRQNT